MGGPKNRGSRTHATMGGQEGGGGSFMSIIMQAMELGMDWTLRIVGPVLICVASTLICSVVYIFFSTVVYFVATPWSFWYFFHSLIVLWFAGNILFNYYSCVLTSPGFAPRESDLAKEDEKVPLSEDARLRKLKPDRSHYCHITKRQVLRMDHFCPWVGNCIGFYNYRYFYLFLFYMWSGCMYGVSITIMPFMMCVHQNRNSAPVPICVSRSQL